MGQGGQAAPLHLGLALPGRHKPSAQGHHWLVPVPSLVAPTFSPVLPLSPLGPWKEEQKGASTTWRWTLAHQCRPPPTSSSKTSFRKPHLCLQLQETGHVGTILAEVVVASGAARWRGQDPKECGHPWHIVSRVPQEGRGISAAGDKAAAIKGALPGVWGAGDWVF